MKKLLSILLVFCLAAGIGVSGAVSANAEENVSMAGLGDILGGLDITDSLVGKSPILGPIMAYDLVCRQESLRPELEAGLLPGKNLDDVLAAMAAVVSGESDELKNIVSNTLPQELEQMRARCEAIFAESFTEEFLAEFNAFKDAFSKALEHGMKAFIKLGSIALSGAILLLDTDTRSEVTELLNWLRKLENVLDVKELGSFAEMTAHFEGITARVDSTMAKIEVRDGQKWWQLLPPFVQFLLRWLCFGWIWMK